MNPKSSEDVHNGSRYRADHAVLQVRQKPKPMGLEEREHHSHLADPDSGEEMQAELDHTSVGVSEIITTFSYLDSDALRPHRAC